MNKNCKIVIAFLLGILAYYFLFNKELVEGACVGPSNQNCGQYNDAQCVDTEARNKGCSIQNLNMSIEGENTKVCSLIPTSQLPGIISGLEGGLPFGGSGNIGTTQMNFIVPNNAQPGQTVTLRTPDGRQIQVTIPESATPGQEITVNVPSGGSGSGSGALTATLVTGNDAASAAQNAANMVIPENPTSQQIQDAIEPILEQTNGLNLEAEDYRTVTYAILIRILNQLRTRLDVLRSGLQYIIDNAQVSGNIAQSFLEAINKGVTPSQLINYINILNSRTQEITTQTQISFQNFLDGNPGPITLEQFNLFLQTIPENSEGATQPPSNSNNSSCTDELFNVARQVVIENDKSQALTLYPICEDRINQIPENGCLDDPEGALNIQTCGETYGAGIMRCPSGQTATNFDQLCSEETCCAPDGTPDVNEYPAGTKIMFCYNDPEWNKVENFLKEQTQKNGGHKVYFTTTRPISYNRNTRNFIDDPDSVIKNSFKNEIGRIYNSIKNDSYFNDDETIREYTENNPDFFDVKEMGEFDENNIISVHLCKENYDNNNDDMNECIWYTDVPEDGLVYTPC